LIASLRDECCQAKLVVLSIRPEVRGQASACGFDAFVSKADPPDSLLSTIKQLCLNSPD